MIRQGDILLVPVEGPAAAAPATTSHVLSAGTGETGVYHAHILEAAEVVAYAEGLVRVAGAGQLVTRDRKGQAMEGRHATLPVPDGLYRVITQREWTEDRSVAALD